MARITVKQLEDAPIGAAVEFPAGTTWTHDVVIVRAVNDGAPEEFLPWRLYRQDGTSGAKATSADVARLSPSWLLHPDDTAARGTL